MFVPEPLVGSTDETRKVPLNVLDVVQFGSKRVQDINDDDFPVGFAFIEKCHDAKDFDLLDLASVSNLFADLTNIEGIIVTFCLGLCVRLIRIFPSLW